MNVHITEVGLKLSQTDLYPPLLSTGMAGVGISTSSATPLEFDFTLNGTPGDVAGVRMIVGGAGGTLLFEQDFINYYSGPWPARLDLHAYRDGQRVDSATLLLHDTRSMVVQRMNATLLPDSVNVPFAEDVLVQVRPEFFDASDILLPVGEVSWEVLPDPAPGVTLDGTRLRVSPEAEVGEVSVTVREKTGVEHVVVLTLLPARDIGLRLEPAQVYPPYIGNSAEIMVIYAEEPLEEGLTLTGTLNGVGGFHPGLVVAPIQGAWMVYIDCTFIANYEGSWPIEIKVRATKDAQVVGIATGKIHDTRTMVCAKVDMRFSPSDTIGIPQQGEVLVIAAPSFYDAEGIKLPHTELSWTAKMVDPIEGATLDYHVLTIGPNAKPGAYRVAIFGPNGLNRAKVLTLS